MDEAIKRSNIRYLIDLEVQVEAKDKPALTCKVRDYCLSGMFLYLQRDAATPLATVPVSQNESITVQFAALDGKRQRIPAQVAHVVSGGFGLRFAHINDEALNALLEIAAAQQARADQSTQLAGAWQSEGRAGLLLLLKDSLQRHLVGLFNTFHESLVDVIFERASRPRNTTEQNQMFEALDLLNRQRSASFQKIFSDIVAGFDDFSSGAPVPARLALAAPVAKGTAELSLVDDRAFEEWLWVSSTVARLEAAHEDALYALNQRLTSLHGRPIDNESNPIGAAAICHAFQELIRQFDVAEPVKELIVTLFQQVMDERFEPLVTEFNHTLIERGILTAVKRDMTIVRLGLGSARESVKPVSLEEARHPAHTPPPATGVATVHNFPPPHRPPPAGAAVPTGVITSGAAHLGATHPGGLPQGVASVQATPSAPSPSGLAQVRSLLRSSQGPAAAQAVASQASPAGGWYGVNELNTALNAIEDRLSTIHANRSKGESILAQLKASLAQMGGDIDKAIPLAQQESIEVIDNLMGSVHEDPIVAAEARPWLERLEMPLLKTALHDASLIENRDHPATHFLNHLDTIGKSLALRENERTRSVRQEISSLIEQVKERSESGEAVFDQALNRLEDLHDSMRRQYEASVTELVRRCNEEYALESKRDALLALLDDYLGGQRVPAVILELMDAGWKNLLLRSYVREGAEGKIFRRFLEVIDQTVARLTGDTRRVGGKMWPEQTLLELIPRGLRQVPVGEELIERLMAKLAPQFAMAAVDPKAIEMKPMPRITGVASEKRRRALEARLAALNISPERWYKAEESVRSMNSGDMITLSDASGHKQAHKLLWVAPNGSRYVFVDGEGHLCADLRLEELTARLLEDKAAVLEGWDVPLMDRATYSMLLSIHNKLLSQSTSDPLTGLLDRRAFGLELEKIVERTRIDRTKNILCALDLDHFALVNSMCGHDEGDRLLKEVAQMLRQHTPENACIGRLSGDEFALLLPDMSRTEGLLAVRTLQQALHAAPFRCANQAYSVAASFGIVEVNENSENATRLLDDIESACRTAKEKGRNRVEIHHDTHEFAEQQKMLRDRVAQVRGALEQGRMQLVCQRILPVTHRDREQAPYYEILLRVHDDEGRPISHEQFIQAAEMSNLTLEVDRWVVQHIVEWLEQRQAAGKTLPIVSMNLSGRSVNSKEFMDAIAARIIRCTLPPNHLCFEITETAAIGDMGQATHFINRIKRLGCSFSLDDFGTGVSSYSYLKALPVDYIKIDGSFVRNCAKEPHDLAVIKSINEVGHAMGKKTVAEFVENEDILARLHDIGVDYAQGYGIEKPVPISQLN
ncbi:MAG TPA: DUF1631 family protein [Gammaproteobacteria bacterium]